MMNENTLIAVMSTVSPSDRTLDGSASTKQITDNGVIPTAEIRITNPRLTTGTHTNIDTSKPNVLQKRKVAIANSPKEHPVSEMIRSGFLPSVSTNLAANNVPTIWTNAITTDDSSGEIFVPDRANIVDAYTINTKTPQLWLRNANTIPITISLMTIGSTVNLIGNLNKLRDPILNVYFTHKYLSM